MIERGRRHFDSRWGLGKLKDSLPHTRTHTNKQRGIERKKNRREKRARGRERRGEGVGRKRKIAWQIVLTEHGNLTSQLNNENPRSCLQGRWAGDPGEDMSELATHPPRQEQTLVMARDGAWHKSTEDTIWKSFTNSKYITNKNYDGSAFSFFFLFSFFFFFFFSFSSFFPLFTIEYWFLFKHVKIASFLSFFFLSSFRYRHWFLLKICSDSKITYSGDVQCCICVLHFTTPTAIH